MSSKYLDLIKEIKIAHLSGLVEKDKDGLVYWKTKYGSDISLEVIEEEHRSRCILRFYMNGKVNRSVEYEKGYMFIGEMTYDDNQITDKVTFDRSKRKSKYKNGKIISSKVRNEDTKVYIRYDENEFDVETIVNVPVYKTVKGIVFESPSIVVEKEDLRVKKVGYYKGDDLIYEDEGEQKK